ncbi:MauE/DoxX family redox-associated membrane protein [Nonlabens xiamenensis]|uniref:MauE/DoxX family redox-associated membrane protein n=1 Tax=Nonlabens xiamenensis TaxID=2341043 RepID=UPI000F608A8C|nr:MauE/DoxX family redox-associated membrane protein [Nonlabens xiamenensis]
MPQLYHTKTDWKSILYFTVRFGLGFYLFVHAVLNLIHYNDFVLMSRQYVPEDSAFGFLAYFTPAVPLIEFFIASMLLIGLYTRMSLKWGISLGVFFTALFHLTGDLETALIHSYTLILKVALFYTIYYNKFSADYFNIWQAVREKSRSRKDKKESENFI